MKKTVQFAKAHWLLLMASLLSCYLLASQQVALTAVNWPTILALATLLLLVQLYQSWQLLTAVAHWLINHSQHSRQLFALAIAASFLGAMLVTNDIAILTMVPIVLTMAEKGQLPAIRTVTFVTLAANLGSALSPFGNPQNLFLFQTGSLTLQQAWPSMLWLLLLGLLSLSAGLWLIPKAATPALAAVSISLNKKQGLSLLVTTLIAIAALLQLLALWLALLLVILVVGYWRPRLFATLDYGILLTFLNFFVLVAYCSQWSFVQQGIATLQGQPASFLASVGLSQVLSNVPTTILLQSAGLPTTALYLGASVGGFGSLLASLANLLAFRSFQAARPAEILPFLKSFTSWNLLFLLIFTSLTYWFLH
ncbi:SLC13 family permease [Leuconostocaceae bacterium ESL0958]|nr:SLC13 family permease [Leuconostocaceae bacterium ESL0958]